jgi:hypothetical protein
MQVTRVIPSTLLYGAIDDEVVRRYAPMMMQRIIGIRPDDVVAGHWDTSATDKMGCILLIAQ